MTTTSPYYIKPSLSDNSSSSFYISRSHGLGDTIISTSPIFVPKTFHSSALIFASIIGSSILHIPYSIYLPGIYLGFGYLIIGMFANLFVCYCLIRVADSTDSINYYGIGDRLIGKRAGIYCELALVIACYRKYVSYLITLKDLPGNLMKAYGNSQTTAGNSKIWVGLFCLIILPVCLVNKLSSLKYLPYMSLAASFIVGGVIISYSITEITDFNSSASEEFTESPYENSDHSLYEYTFPITRIFTAFSCQCNVLYIYSYLNFRDIPRGMTVVTIGMFTVNLLYMLVGCFGYFLIYENNGNIGNVFNDMDDLSFLAAIVNLT